jgi:PAS domain S-box-containing protein
MSSPSGSPPPPFLALSRTFWRGVTTTHGLSQAVAEVLAEYATHAETRRVSVWLHERRARQLALIATSRPDDAPTRTTISTADTDAPAARGLRLDRAQLIDDAPEVVLLAPLRGWRRALGTLVVEGAAETRFSRQEHLELAADLGRQLSVGIENVQLLEEMLAQRRILEDTFNSLADLVAVTDRSLRVVQSNDAFAMRLGQARPELLDRPLADLVGADLAAWIAAPDDGQSGDAMRVRTVEHPNLGGTFSVTATPLINEDGETVGNVMVARDITRQTALETEKEALRARLAQSERLASLGQFVAGIAHEINNPLQGVLGHLELLMWTPPDQPKESTPARRTLRKELRRIHHEADRAATIVRNLLAFTGSQRMTRRRLRVDRVVSRALATRRNALTRAGIEIVRTQAEGVPPVVGDQLLLQQALLNVLTNAEHAIVRRDGPRRIAIHTDSPRPSTVRIAIEDTGHGIDPAILPRIFDPFFTTKDVGEGTGLGLALTYGVIQEHGGTIQAANARDGGAVFTIELPAADAPAGAPARDAG